jgi:hypothetical protein
MLTLSSAEGGDSAFLNPPRPADRDHATDALARAGGDDFSKGPIPRRLIFAIKVVRGRPSRAAAPFGPPTTPSV